MRYCRALLWTETFQGGKSCPWTTRGGGDKVFWSLESGGGKKVCGRAVVLWEEDLEGFDPWGGHGRRCHGTGNQVSEELAEPEKGWAGNWVNTKGRRSQPSHTRAKKGAIQGDNLEKGDERQGSLLIPVHPPPRSSSPCPSQLCGTAFCLL